MITTYVVFINKINKKIKEKETKYQKIKDNTGLLIN